jgi:PEP-CTERM motif
MRSTGIVWRLATAIALAGAIAAPTAARAVAIVAPNGYEAVDGDTGNLFPFFATSVTNDSMRYQQVYDASEFATIAPGGGMITEIAFRAHSESPPFAGALASVQIDLSTTAAVADGLSTVFADNIGSDVTTVFGPAPFAISSRQPANFTSTAKPFEIVFPLLTPFFYDPALGNLLLELRIPVQAAQPVLATTAFDGTISGSDATSRVYSYSNGVDSPTADQIDTYGLITRFTATPVPEPGTLALVAVGLAVLAHRRRG